MVTLQELAKLTALSIEEVTEDVEELKAEGTVYTFAMKKDIYVWHRSDEAEGTEKILGTLAEYHKKYPYRPGMKKAEIHMTYMKKVKLNVFDLYVEMLSEEGALKRHQEFLQLPEFEVRKDAVYEKVLKTVQKQFEKAQFDFQRFSEFSFGNIKREEVEDIMLLLIDEDIVVKITEDIYTLKSIIEKAKEVIQNRLKENPLITIAEVRDLLGTSRKSAKPILEYMDSIRVTKKNGTESERVAYV